MAKAIFHGLAKEDDPMFSRPMTIGTVRRASDYLNHPGSKESAKATGGKEDGKENRT